MYRRLVGVLLALFMVGFCLVLIPESAKATPGIALTVSKTCLTTPSDTVTSTSPVGTGDDLVLLVSGQGYASAAPVVTSVSDNVNGTWTPLVNDQSLTTDKTHYLSYAVYHFTNSAPSTKGLTVTIKQNAGQTAASAELLDISGPVTEDATAFSQGLQTASATISSPSALVPSGDLAVGLIGAYAYGQTFAVGSGWTLDKTATSCTRALAESQVVSTQGSLGATAAVNGSTTYVGGIIAFSSKSAPTIPAAPANIAATPGNASAVVSWSAPSSNGGSAITGYQITPYLNGVPQTAINTGSTVTSYTVTGLTNGSSYTFAIAAMNAIGIGPLSAQSNAVMPNAPTAPAPPTAVAATAGNASASLTWIAPSNSGGSGITGYQVTPWINGTAQTPLLTGNITTTYTVSGLTNGTTYTFTVAAQNSVGTGTDSSASNAVTPSAPTAPGAPSNVMGNAGNGSVNLSWTAPSSNGGSAITGYQVTPYVNGAAQTAINTGSANTTYTVPGLTNGTAYTFAVAAINAVGIGSASAQSNAITPISSVSTITPMSVIDHGLPTYGDGNVIYSPSDGTSGSYGGGSASYLCGPPCGLIVNLSSVPLAQRQQVVVSWYNDETNYYAAAINGQYYNEPRDYTIDVSNAPDGSNPPTTWTTLVSVTGNFYNGREHFLNLSGANWIRMEVTGVNGSSGNNDASFNLDVNDASKGNNDTWLVLGDSITQDDMGHYEAGNFMQQINAAYPAYFPSEINGGIGGWDASSPLQTDPRTGQIYIDEFLAAFPGHFVSLDYGTNNANEGGSAMTSYMADMTTLVNKVIAAGKIPVLRQSMPWGCTANIEANGPTVNADLAQLAAEYPQIIVGADEWSYFKSNPSLIGSDCIHPTIGTGNAAYRQVYVNALISGVYKQSN